MAGDEGPRSRTGRGPARLKSMSKKINRGEKISLPIDVNTGVATGPYAKNFSSYLRVVARERIFILTDSWDHVNERNMIWQDILVCNYSYFVQSEVFYTLFNLKFVCLLLMSSRNLRQNYLCKRRKKILH